ncbi:TadE/TadG family type IV pilus assembly protein [Hoeflea olei]|uniref:VWFA domain-containing protein n=1 Tax=Hoeflea olei TaxID=1480615 RepID=A0A1C1YYF0_9HYPH|nr:TadE/TadG family type IV pilus assembly protein [Hoeflea olei]OCW58439.1 hypothetical protein AWJ14_18220 [Hoeflea olei]
MHTVPTTFKFADMIRSRDGNFAMMASLLLPVIFVAGSLVLDTTNALSMKTSLQNAADSAALATASQLAEGEITEGEAEAYAINFFNAQISGDASQYDGFSATPSVKLSKTGTGATTLWKVEVDVTGSQTTSGLSQFTGRRSIDVTIAATSESGSDGTDRSPLSMMLVLDHSGSMKEASGSTRTEQQTNCYWSWSGYRCYTQNVTVDVPKMDVLKQAVTDLVDHIKEADPTDEYARMGAVAYNSQTGSGDKLAANWNKSKVTSFTNALVADGGTNSEPAMKWATEQISSSTEVNAHFSKNGSKEPKKYIVFMTDGQNDFGRGSYNEWLADEADKQTLKYCAQAKAANVTVYTVAFQAPPRGKQLLLACASGSDKFYDAQSAEDLLDAFTDIGREASKQKTRLTS